MIIEFTFTAHLAGETGAYNPAVFHGHADTIEEAKEAVRQLNALSSAIGAMQAPGPDSIIHELKGAPITTETPAEEVPNVQPKSTDTTSGEQSAPTGESSSPKQTLQGVLDYAAHVKPITIRLSKEKGREITIGVLSHFGVKSAQDLDAGQWADYIAHCEKVLAGGEA